MLFKMKALIYSKREYSSAVAVGGFIKLKVLKSDPYMALESDYEYL